MRNVPFKLRKAARNIKYVRSASPVLHPKRAATVQTNSPIVFGFYVNWDPASMVSLRMSLAHLTHLVPEWLILQNAQGDLEDQSDPTVIAIAGQAKLPIIALVTNYRDGWQPGDVRKILHDADARDDLIDNIYSNLAEHHFAGVNIDFEKLPFLQSAYAHIMGRTAYEAIAGSMTTATDHPFAGILDRRAQGRLLPDPEDG